MCADKTSFRTKNCFNSFVQCLLFNFFSNTTDILAKDRTQKSPLASAAQWHLSMTPSPQPLSATPNSHPHPTLTSPNPSLPAAQLYLVSRRGSAYLSSPPQPLWQAQCVHRENLSYRKKTKQKTNKKWTNKWSIPLKLPADDALVCHSGHFKVILSTFSFFKSAAVAFGYAGGYRLHMFRRLEGSRRQYLSFSTKAPQGRSMRDLWTRCWPQVGGAGRRTSALLSGCFPLFSGVHATMASADFLHGWTQRHQ